jgi:hypothetical protein
MGIIECGKCNCCSPPGVPPCSPGCCKCPPSGDVCFDILDCQAYYLFENTVTHVQNWAPIDSCCTGMSFTLTHALGYSLCNEEGHNPGLPDDDGDTCLTTGTGAGMPTGIGTGELPELWGFSGTVCGDCSGGAPRPDNLPWSGGWDEPSWKSEECDGMCLKASLCCCVSPFGTGTGGGSPPPGQGNRCAGGATLGERNSNCACGVSCYKFTMAPFDCHKIPNSVLCPPATGDYYCGPEYTMSACSPCSFLESPMASSVHPEILPPYCPYTGCEFSCELQADVTGSNMGAWAVDHDCPPAIARGQEACGVIPYTGASLCSGTCPNESGTRSFMVLVEGVYESQCDCAKGIFDWQCAPVPPPEPCPDPPCPPPVPGGSQYPDGVGYMKSVFVKFTALLSEC